MLHERLYTGNYEKRGRCVHKASTPEATVEAWLFENLGRFFQDWRTEWEVKEARRKQSTAAVDRAALRRKLTRLKDLGVSRKDGT